MLLKMIEHLTKALTCRKILDTKVMFMEKGERENFAQETGSLVRAKMCYIWKNELLWGKCKMQLLN